MSFVKFVNHGWSMNKNIPYLMVIAALNCRAVKFDRNLGLLVTQDLSKKNILVFEKAGTRNELLIPWSTTLDHLLSTIYPRIFHSGK